MPAVKVSTNTKYDDLPDWLTIRQASSYLGVSTYTLYEGVKRGTVPHRRVGLRLIHVPKHHFSPEQALA